MFVTSSRIRIKKKIYENTDSISTLTNSFCIWFAVLERPPPLLILFDAFFNIIYLELTNGKL